MEVEIRLCGGGEDAFGRGRWAEWSPDKTVLTFSVRYVLAHPRLSRPSRVCQSVIIPYNFLNPLNTDFNPSTTGLLYARESRPHNAAKVSETAQCYAIKDQRTSNPERS
jgi:hypothetical protein